MRLVFSSSLSGRRLLGMVGFPSCSNGGRGLEGYVIATYHVFEFFLNLSPKDGNEMKKPDT